MTRRRTSVVDPPARLIGAVLLGMGLVAGPLMQARAEPPDIVPPTKPQLGEHELMLVTDDDGRVLDVMEYVYVGVDGSQLVTEPTIAPKGRPRRGALPLAALRVGHAGLPLAQADLAALPAGAIKESALLDQVQQGVSGLDSALPSLPGVYQVSSEVATVVQYQTAFQQLHEAYVHAGLDDVEVQVRDLDRNGLSDVLLDVLDSGLTPPDFVAFWETFDALPFFDEIDTAEGDFHHLLDALMLNEQGFNQRLAARGFTFASFLERLAQRQLPPAYLLSDAVAYAADPGAFIDWVMAKGDGVEAVVQVPLTPPAETTINTATTQGSAQGSTIAWQLVGEMADVGAPVDLIARMRGKGLDPHAGQPPAIDGGLQPKAGRLDPKAPGKPGSWSYDVKTYRSSPGGWTLVSDIALDLDATACAQYTNLTPAPGQFARQWQLDLGIVEGSPEVMLSPSQQANRGSYLGGRDTGNPADVLQVSLERVPLAIMPTTGLNATPDGTWGGSHRHEVDLLITGDGWAYLANSLPPDEGAGLPQANLAQLASTRTTLLCNPRPGGLLADKHNPEDGAQAPPAQISGMPVQGQGVKAASAGQGSAPASLQSASPALRAPIAQNASGVGDASADEEWNPPYPSSEANLLRSEQLDIGVATGGGWSWMNVYDTATSGVTVDKDRKITGLVSPESRPWTVLCKSGQQALQNYELSMAAGYVFSDRREDVVSLYSCPDSGWFLSSTDKNGVTTFAQKVSDQPRGFVNGSIVIADLDGYADRDAGRRDEIAFIPGGEHRLHVIGFPQGYEPGAQPFHLELPLPDSESFTAQYIDPGSRQPTRPGVQVVAGDFDGDGTNELAVVYFTGPNGLNMKVVTYRLSWKSRKPELQQVSVYENAVTGLFNALGLAVASANFDAYGGDELAITWTTKLNETPSALVRTQVLGFDRRLVATSLGVADVTQTSTFQTNRTGNPWGPEIAPVAMIAGRFRYNPELGFGFDNRQLLICDRSTHTAPGTQYIGHLLDIKLRDGDRKAEIKMHRSLLRTEADRVYRDFMLVSGNFAGAARTQRSAAWAPILGLYGAYPDGDVWRRYVHLTAYELDVASSQFTPVHQATTRFADISPAYERDWFSGTIASVAYDRHGESLHLGNPVRVELSNLEKLSSLLMEPPKHLAYLPDEPDSDPKTGLLNVSWRPDFNVSITDSNSSKAQSEMQFVSGTSVFAGGGFGLKQFVDIAGSGASTEFRSQSRASLDSTQSRIDQSYTEQSQRIKAETNHDDVLIGTVGDVVLWRYPITTRQVKDKDGEEKQVYFDLVVPGEKSRRILGPGRYFEWYAPIHENGNILSYPNENQAPDDVQEIKDREGNPIKGVLVNPIDLVWGPVSGGFELEWNKSISRSEKFSSTMTLANETELSGSIKSGAKLQLSAVFIKADIEAYRQLSANFKAGFEKALSAVATAVTTTTSGFAVSVKKPAGDSRYAYEFSPNYYISKGGAKKMFFQVRTPGEKWWRDTYSKPDLALNLPRRYKETTAEFSRDAYWNRVRGVVVASQIDGKQPAELPPLSRAAWKGEKLAISVPVYNMSLTPVENTFSVRLEAIALDQRGNEVGPRRFVDEVEVKPMVLRERRVVHAQWDTTAFTSPQGGLQSYRLYSILDAGNAVDELNEETTDDGQLNPGRNNVGYVEVTLSASPPPQGDPLTSGSEQGVEAMDINAAPDVFARSDALSIMADDAQPGSQSGVVSLGERVSLRYRVYTEGTSQPSYLKAALFDRDPNDPEAVITAMAYVKGVPVDGGSMVQLDWLASEPGPQTLFAAILEDLDGENDAVRGNSVAAIDLVVEPGRR